MTLLDACDVVSIDGRLLVRIKGLRSRTAVLNPLNSYPAGALLGLRRR